MLRIVPAAGHVETSCTGENRKQRSTHSAVFESRSRYAASGSSRLGGATATMAIFATVAVVTLFTLPQMMPKSEAPHLLAFDVPAPPAASETIRPKDARPPEEPVAEEAAEIVHAPAPSVANDFEKFSLIPSPASRQASEQVVSTMPVAIPAPRPVQPSAPRNETEADTWEGRVLAALNASRRYPRLAISRRQQGRPYVRFVMDRMGKVLSVRLERSSGFAELDREAVALPKRASPLPRPEDDRQGTTIELVVPIEFFLS